MSLSYLRFQGLHVALRIKARILQSVQSLSHVRLFATLWTAARQSSLSITNSRSLPKPMSIESVMSSSHLILCRPLLLLPSVFPSIRVFSNESTLCIRWPKYQSFSFNISPSNEHPGLIFRLDWLDLLAVQGTLKSLLQHHSSKASIFWRSAFFTVQLSHPYMTTAETVALTRQTFVDKVMLIRSHMFWCHFFHPVFFVLIILLVSVPLQNLKHCPSVICGLPSPTPNISHLPYSFSLSSFCLDIIVPQRVSLTNMS